MYNEIAEHVIQASASQSIETQKVIASSKRMGRLKKRKTTIQIRTGYYVKVENLYAESVPKGYVGSRHLLDLFWRVEKNASPMYYSIVNLFSVLSPSFEVASQILDIQKIRHNIDRVKTLTRHIAQKSIGHQAELTRSKGETFGGKRIIIGIDGGRTRMRYEKPVSEDGKKGYETPWNEPKMFVIEVLTEKGTIDYDNLPIYGCAFGADEIIDLLSTHLQGMDIESAGQIQIVADGAPWIWNRVKPMLLKLGVAENKIVETLDYYHAVAHLNPIVEAIVKKNKKGNKDKTTDETKQNKAQILKNFKNLLWTGQITELIKNFKTALKRPTDEVKTAMTYFEKNPMYPFKKVLTRASVITFHKMSDGNGIIKIIRDSLCNILERIDSHFLR